MMEQSLADFFAGWELFADSALAAAVAGAALGLLGVYVVLRRMVFLSAALSQAAGLGVALAFYIHVIFDWHGLSPTLGAMVCTALAAALMVGSRSVGARRDSMLGLIYLVGSAGTLALGTRIVEELHDIHTLLFGSAVAVSHEDFNTVLLMAALVMGLQVWLGRGFIAASFDRDGAMVRGLPVRQLDLLLIAALAASTSVCTRVLGALPVLAFTVLPAMAAVRLTANVTRSIWLAAALGAVSGFGGYILAFLLSLPVGAAQTLVAVLLVVVLLGASGLVARLRSYRGVSAAGVPNG